MVNFLNFTGTWTEYVSFSRLRLARPHNVDILHVDSVDK